MMARKKLTKAQRALVISAAYRRGLISKDEAVRMATQLRRKRSKSKRKSNCAVHLDGA